jgi:hypothetical protein
MGKTGVTENGAAPTRDGIMARLGASRLEEKGSSADHSKAF